MATKICVVCGKAFEALKSAKTCVGECREILKNRRNDKCRRTERYRLRVKSYQQNHLDKVRQWKRSYRRSDKGKISERKYNQSDKGRALHRSGDWKHSQKKAIIALLQTQEILLESLNASVDPHRLGQQDD